MRKIVDALRSLAERPTDESFVAFLEEALQKDANTFMSTVMAHFSVPTSERQEVHKAHPDALQTAKTWQNYVGTETAEPLAIASPKTLRELQDSLVEARKLRCPVRAVGSHHAWSDAALTDGIAIETHGLLEPLVAADASLLKDPRQATTLVRASAGMTIKDLNAALDKHGLALINMGGFDGQTLAGVISTSTHGSGLLLGSFPSFVEALVVVGSDGQVSQIEKANGITDPQKFHSSVGNIRLVQDDKVFSASVVGVGCLGIIFAVILRVRSQYWLSETRTLHKWSDLRKKLLDDNFLRQYRHVEVLINPHVIKGQNTSLLTVRHEVPQPTKPSPPKPFRNAFSELLASLPGAGEFLVFLFRTWPRLSPILVENAITSLEDSNEFVAPSFTILNIGAANGFPAVCSELGVDLDKHVDATDSVLTVASQARAQGMYQSGLIALRYVAPSPGFLSMQPRETCMIELPMMRGVFGSDSLPWQFEELLTKKFGARPHWGQRNFLTGSHDMLEQLYGHTNLQSWLEVFKSFNPSGQFNSRFTDRVGFSSHAPCGTSVIK